MSMIDLKLQVGDCILTTDNGWLSKTIRFFTSMQTANAWCSHAAAAIGYVYCVEAVDRIRINNMRRFDKPNIAKRIYRLPLTQKQQDNFLAAAYAAASLPYGYTKLPLFALDALATRIVSLFGDKEPVFFFTKYFGIFNIPVCSQLYVYLLGKAGVVLYDKNEKSVSWKIVSPDYLDDLMQLPINKAERLI